VTYLRRFLRPDDLDFLIARALAKTFFMTRRSDADNLTETNTAPVESLSNSIDPLPKKSTECHSGPCIQHISVFLDESLNERPFIVKLFEKRLLNRARRGISGFNLL